MIQASRSYHLHMSSSTMASADLREELNCCICLSLYTEPISLTCGHNFCHDCIVYVLDKQQSSREYSCPVCRQQYKERPILQKNRTLCNIVECFRSARQEESGVLCTYCDSPVPASKSCVNCEASFCDKHLSNHSKLTHHVLTEPTTSFGNWKCSTHQEMLKYYCMEDNACICMSCCVAGDHRGHQVELLKEASEKMKDKLRESKSMLNSERQEIERRIQNLENHKIQETEKNIAMARKVAELFREVRSYLDNFEKNVLLETCRQKKQLSLSVSDLVQQLELQRGKLSGKMNELEELCNIQDPMTILNQAPKSVNVTPEIVDTINKVGSVGCLAEGVISNVVKRGVYNFICSLNNLMAKRLFSEMKKSDIVLDINTAHDNVILSKKRNRASYTDVGVSRPDDPKRFKCNQVLSLHTFTSGTHYWEADVSEAKEWLIGVAAESIERKIAGNKSFLGCNDKSWGLIQRNGLQVKHKNIATTIDYKSSLRTVAVHLDYKAGLLSFYQLCDPVRHLHTFTATFTEPLHAAFYLFPKSSIRIIH